MTNSISMNAREQERAERRDSPRVRLHLRLAVVYPERDGRPYHPIYHARTHDICMSGLSMVVEDNVFYEGEVTILLTLPPVHAWAAPKIITSTAGMTYAIRSSKLNGYKIGMTFMEFQQDGKELLQAALQRELIKIGLTGRQDSGLGLRACRPRSSQPLR